MSVLEAAAAFAPRQGPAQRLSRAALYAFGVGSLSVATACSSSTSGSVPFYGSAVGMDSGPQADGGADAEPDSPGVVTPAYGAPGHPRPDADGESEAGEDAEVDAPTIQPMYGIASDASLPTSEDASADDASH